MRHRYFRTTILTLILNLFAITAFPQTTPAAQDPNASTEINCANELSNLVQFMKIKLPDYALQPWRMLFKHCPAASKNIYIIGTQIFTKKAESTKDPVLLKAYTDTLMMIYDQRIKHFGEEGKVLGFKGTDLLLYQRETGIPVVKEGYDILKKSIDLEKEHTTPTVLNLYITCGITLFMEKQLTNEQLINDYIMVIQYLDTQLKARPSSRAQQAKDIINQNIKDSKVMTCEAINQIYAPKFEANKDNLNFLKLVSGFLNDAQCEGEEFYATVAERLYQLEPSAQSAYNLARLFFKKENYEKAKAYYLEAINVSTVDAEKANYYYELGIVYNAFLKQPQQAVAAATEAIKLKSDWGEPWILIGQAYLSGKNSFQDSFDQETVFWVVVDMFQKAKSVDPKIAEKANGLINEYSNYFPSKEDVFFRTLAVGQTYNVGGWINRSTTVRTR